MHNSFRTMLRITIIKRLVFQPKICHILSWHGLFVCPILLLHTVFLFFLFLQFSYRHCLFSYSFILPQLRTYLLFVSGNDNFFCIWNVCKFKCKSTVYVCTIKSLWWCVTSAFCTQNYCSIDISDQMKRNNGVYLHNWNGWYTAKIPRMRTICTFCFANLNQMNTI